MMLRAMSYDPHAPSYDVMTRNQHGDFYTQMTEDDLSAVIGEAEPAQADRLRSLRRLVHRFPWSWVPMTAVTVRRAA
jgi:hypothetical protein